MVRFTVEKIELEQAGEEPNLRSWRHDGLEPSTFFLAMTKSLDDILQSVSRRDEDNVKSTVTAWNMTMAVLKTWCCPHLLTMSATTIFQRVRTQQHQDDS